MTNARVAWWIACLCALWSAAACSGGDEGDGGGTPDAGIFDSGDDSPDAGGVGEPTEECAATCEGCCDGDACLSGNSPNACGSAGGICAVCDPGFVCELGACTVDRTSRWDVLADTGEVFEDNSGGGTWDPVGGLPDPYVDMMTSDGIDDLTGSTPATVDTLAPSWNHVVLADVPAGALVDNGVSITILDDDALFDPSDSMGTCQLLLGDAEFTGDVITHVCPSDSEAGARGWTLRLRLIRK